MRLATTGGTTLPRTVALRPSHVPRGFGAAALRVVRPLQLGLASGRCKLTVTIGAMSGSVKYLGQVISLYRYFT